MHHGVVVGVEERSLLLLTLKNASFVQSFWDNTAGMSKSIEHPVLHWTGSASIPNRAPYEESLAEPIVPSSVAERMLVLGINLTS
eukprot:4342635-Amphidinium_carterae.1